MAILTVASNSLAFPPLQPGESLSFAVPIASGGASIHEGVRLEVSGAPAWLVIEPTSLLGPVDVFPSLGYNFRLDFTIGSNLDASYPTLAMDVHVKIASTTARLKHFVWRITSSDALRTLSATCLEDSGELCGHVQEPDTTPSSTTVRYIWSHFETGGEMTFVAPHTLIELEAVDPELSDAATSGLAAIEFAVEAATAAEGPLRPYGLPFALDEGLRRLRVSSRDNAGNVEPVRSVILSVDGTPPSTSLTTSGPRFADREGRIHVSSLTRVGIKAEDLASSAHASGVAFSEFAVDPATSRVRWVRFAEPFALQEGLRSIVARSWDRVDNLEEKKAFELRVDTTPPGSHLALDGPNHLLTDLSLLVSTRTALSIVAADPVSAGVASGVRDTQLSVSGSSFAVIVGSFSLSGPDGPKELRWFSRDNVLNEEPVQSTPVVLDSTPPSLTLSCPAPASPSFCRIFDALAPLRGSVQDLHLASWRLESAPGRSAADGFTLISSGTANLDGLLGILDASILSGFITLRLSAEDLVGNSSVLTVEAFAGDPARVFTLGGRKAFEKPSGLAVDFSSRIYVADAGKDRVLVYNPDGSFLHSYGTDGRREAAFKQPSGVAVDAAGNVWVADTDNHRVVKLSSEGDVLALIGRHEAKRGIRRFKPGKGPGEFKRPSAIAVDASGQAYVADTGNRRIQVLGPDGSFLRAIAMPPIPNDDEHDEEDEDGESPHSLGVPVGVTVDGAGMVYVSDRKGRRVVVFSASGELVRTIDSQFEQPWGVVVSRDGKCLAVSDRESGLIRRFDEEGRPLLMFQAAEKPLGLALADVLYVADAEKDQVLGFGMPVNVPIVASGESPEQEKGKGGFHAAALASAAAPTSVLARVGKAGGAVLRSDRAGVEVPEGSLDEEVELGVHAAEPFALRAESAKRAKLAEVGPAVELAPHGLVFDRPVSLSLPYDKSRGWQARDLAVFHFDEEAGRWVALPTTIDEAAGLARAETSHFSVYQVLGPETAQPAAPSVAVLAAANAAFVFRDLYAFPNPSRGSRRPTIRLQVGVADSVEVNIYDVSGERVHSAAFGPPVVLDDGNGKGPQWTYDHAWDAGGAGSGVYIYVVTAKKTGHGDIRKSGRLAVIR